MKALFSSITSVSTGVPAETRTAAYDWSAPAGKLDQFGCAVLPKLPSPTESIAGLYPEGHFRSLWRGAVSARVSTATSNIRSRSCWRVCGGCSSRALWSG
jgi:hypothetical protein